MTTPSQAPSTEFTSSSGLVRRLLHRPALRFMLATLVAGLLSAGATSPATAAETCANATLRELNNSTELPECRAYEMVSPSYKQGFGVNPDPGSFADDGVVAFSSTGNFAGSGWGGIVNQYLGARTPGGWETRSLTPPRTLYDLRDEGLLFASSDLRSTLWVVALHDQSNGVVMYTRDDEGQFARLGQGPAPDFPLVPHLMTESDDLSHVVFNSQPDTGDIWEYVGVGSAAVARLVNVDNTGASTSMQGAPCSGRISGDGRVVAFTSNCNAGIPQVWARVAGSATVAVSRSECTRVFTDPGGACNGLSPAAYAGAARDGSRVFFTTDQQLVNGDRDLTTDLYACDIPPGSPVPVGVANPCTTLTEVSGAADGARVESVAAVSQDGSKVYFTAQGVLAENLGSSGVGAVADRQNLYLWTKDAAHPAGQTTFVGELNGGGLSGAQMTPDGRYLVFSTTTALVNSGPGADTDGVADVYRYDADTGSMLRLSTSVTGSGGNEPGFDATPSGVSADGSTVVFTTAEALSPQDTDGVADVYLWHDGRVSLISHDGGQALWISSTGQDVYFLTGQRLTAADGDVNTDIYDARIGGGFDLTQPMPCSGDACQGAPSTPPVSGTPSSETLQGTGNLPLTASDVKATSQPASKPLTRRQKLAKALKGCREKPKHKRVACERQARKRYGPVNKSARRSHR